MLPPLRLRALYADIDVEVSGPAADEVHAGLQSRWAECWRDPSVPVDGPVRRIEVDASSAPCVAGDAVVHQDLDQLPTAVTHAVTRLAIESGIGRLLMLHAAGLADPATGASVACVARGGTGKTTLCRTLAPGRRYLTDETVAITSEGVVVPYPKPLSVRRGHGEIKDELTVRGVGLRTAGATPWLAAIVVLRRDPAHTGPPQVEELDLFDAILALSEETSSLSRLHRPLHLIADLVEMSRPVLSVTYAEATSLDGLITELIGAPGAHP